MKITHIQAGMCVHGFKSQTPLVLLFFPLGMSLVWNAHSGTFSGNCHWKISVRSSRALKAVLLLFNHRRFQESLESLWIGVLAPILTV